MTISFLYAIKIPADSVNCPKVDSRLCSRFQSSQHGMTTVAPGCRFLSFSLCQLMRGAQCVVYTLYSCHSSHQTLRKKYPQGVCRRYAFHAVSFWWCENGCQRREAESKGGNNLGSDENMLLSAKELLHARFSELFVSRVPQEATWARNFMYQIKCLII